MNKILTILICLTFVSTTMFAGNPDRQGEAGAYELLMNPWARSAGLHTINTSSISGVESMRLNPAGLTRIEGRSEFVGAHTFYLQGTGIGLNAFGFAQKIGVEEGKKSYGTFGVSIMAVDFGDIAVTTVGQPEGTGATFTPNFFNLGISYGHMFDNKVSVGVTFRVISESTANLRAAGFAIDAGIQYVAGSNADQDAFKIGISLRNVGSPMSFGGEGLSQQLTNPEGVSSYELTYNQRSARYELPSVLNIGISYDFEFTSDMELTIMGNFTSNSFSQDNLGAGLEFKLNDMFALRGAYKYTIGQFDNDGIEAPVYTGLSGGLSVMLPLNRDTGRKLGIDYAYRATNPWNGSHNLSVRISL